MATVYVRNDVRDAVFCTDLGTYIPLIPGTAHDTSDPIVREHRWAFTEEQPPPRKATRSVPVEQATAAPGEERKTRRP